ncbi:MAG: hypothetical protein HY752_03645 [Nitrospirae bacterium]|nr:hypothetical protein [Nitrospirota bacterium]
MTENIVGKRYDFQVVCDKIDEKYFTFYTRAICKITKRTACINNLNGVLSELLIGHEAEKYDSYPQYYDSTWITLGEKAKRFAKIAKDFLVDSRFINYLENKLDDDRGKGEWENIVTENGK